MNFEDWEAQEDPKQANDRLIDICEEIKKQGMPPFSYRIVHQGYTTETRGDSLNLFVVSGLSGESSWIWQPPLIAPARFTLRNLGVLYEKTFSHLLKSP